MNAIKLIGFSIFALFLFFQNAYAAGWEKIEVPNVEMTVIDDNGQYIDIKPGCAFSYLPDEAGLPNKPFHFYYRQGKNDKILIYFNGGGACWNDATCITSLKLTELGGRPIYNPSMDLENTPGEINGIVDFNHPNNPVGEWSMVFIPYCTGDSHIGSSDTLYNDLPNPLGFVNGGNPLMVQHRGFDNFMVVREWLKNESDRTKVEHVLISGSSAGSYGALLNFSRLHSLYPKKTKVALLADAGAGVFTQHFLDLVFNPGGPWGVENTLATWIPGINQYSTYDAATFYGNIMTGMAGYFPKSRFAHYTTAWDVIQVLFLNVMKQTDIGSVNPIEWNEIPQDTWYEWNDRMLGTFNMMTLVDNVRYYIGAGTFHTGLTDLFKPILGYFYLENSAANVFLTDWVKRLITDDKKSELKNLKCDGDCEAPAICY
ncbi:pectin acetylesterase-family hydrolase [Nitrosomonas sp. Nm132]|uniref:pectin acetylesterase-family hydrolase n=1 Tax=Nitrosomonas sp. Nm132 TaxID=1881053 RepID=UPI000881936A|nr:pectin acetylesterase-family hydrolase [Nitrosomonas sp. Nm132]SDH91915.1 Pectinacetylesterase [Nitrosomonas sp. Nm132]